MAVSKGKQQGRRQHHEARPPAKLGDKHDTAVRGSLYSVFALSLLGLADMVYLTRLHWAVHSIPGHSSFCAISAEMDCDAVAASPFSVLFGVPVSFWGVLAYLALVGLAAWGLWVRSARQAVPGFGLGLLAVAAAGSLLASATLGYISAVHIESFCLMCALGYLINTGIALAVGLALYSLRQGPIAAFCADSRYLLARPSVSASLAALAVALGVGTLTLYPTPSVKAEEHPSKNPELVRVSASAGEQRQHGAGSPFNADSPFKGTRGAPVTIVEFTDYECAYCKRSHAQLGELLAPYEGRYQVLHRHFPLDQACNPSIPRPFNQSSCLASRYAICAGEQGLFWEVNSLLFSVPGRLNETEIKRLTQSAGCDMKKLEECLETELPDRALARDVQDGITLGIRGTPTFFINDQRVVGLPTKEVLESFFD